MVVLDIETKDSCVGCDLHYCGTCLKTKRVVTNDRLYGLKRPIDCPLKEHKCECEELKTHKTVLIKEAERWKNAYDIILKRDVELQDKLAIAEMMLKNIERKFPTQIHMNEYRNDATAELKAEKGEGNEKIIKTENC